MHPDQKTDGNFQRHLNRFWWPKERRSEFHGVRIAASEKGKLVSQTLKCRAPHDVLNSEFIASGPNTAEQVDDIVARSLEWGSYYKNHPRVRARRPEDPAIIPCAIYLDGVRYSRQTGTGRQKNMILLTVYNLATLKRHVIALLNKAWLCSCGCRGGMCSLWHLFNFFAWSFHVVEKCKFPPLDLDGPWADGTMGPLSVVQQWQLSFCLYK